MSTRSHDYPRAQVAACRALPRHSAPAIPTHTLPAQCLGHSDSAPKRKNTIPASSFPWDDAGTRPASGLCRAPVCSTPLGRVQRTRERFATRGAVGVTHCRLVASFSVPAPTTPPRLPGRNASTHRRSADAVPCCLIFLTRSGPRPSYARGQTLGWLRLDGGNRSQRKVTGLH